MRQFYRLLTIFFCVVCVASVTAQVRTVTFTGRDRTNQYHIPLSTVTVFNLDQLWEEVLYYPDTVLFLGSVGVEDFVTNQEIQLMQNVPNPFDGTTEFALHLPEDRDVVLEIYDITGRLAIGERFNALAAGTHLFQATLASPQIYLLSAKVDKNQMTIKMVNEGHGAGNAIRHMGMTNKDGDFTVYLKSDKASSNYPFQVGDEMRYIGSAVVDGTQLESEIVTQAQVNNETVPLKFDVTAPTVTTADIVEFHSTFAVCGGVVTANGGSPVTARGVCWSISQNPTINDSHTTDGSGIGSFTSNITNLTPNTTYYVRAYATNGICTVYGEQKTFTTLCNALSVNISGLNTILYGQSTTLTALGANTYQWSTGATTESITVSPTVTTTYTVTGTNSYGCTDMASITVMVNPIAPTVTTNNVTNIDTNSATCGGNVTSTGGSATMSGVCWRTSQNPTVNDSHTTDGSGIGSFTSNITGLMPNTTYYVRAYASNIAGTSYGEQKTFTTLCNSVTVNITGNTTINFGQSNTLTASGASTYRWSTNATSASITVNPTATTTYTVTGTNSYGCTATASVTVTVNPIAPTVTTNNVTNISAVSATCGGNVTSDGGAATSRGVCWSTSPNPTVSNSHTSDGTGTGSFTSNITGLTPNTTYYVRAYATNSAGTSYGVYKTFTTSCNTVTVNISGSTTINYGQSTTLTVSGANTYYWSTGHVTGAESITVSPTATTTYTVTGTNSYGCTGTASITVTVNPIAPTVTTNNVTNIGTNSATCGGNVTSTGGGTTTRGVCWSTSQNPTINDSHTTDGSGTGSFTSSITGLNPNTTYYVRAYATNSAGTSYGEQKTFATFCNSVPVNITGNTTINYGQNTTLTASGANTYRWSTNATTASISVSPTATTTYMVTGTNNYGCAGTASATVTVNYIKPTVTTNNISNIAQFTATCGGNVTFDGGKPVTAHGVCWSTSQNPTIADNHTTDGTGTGSFSSSITGLTPNTTYYVRAYATNSMGTSYGEQKTFTTLCYNENYVTVVTDCEKYFWHNVEYTESGTYTYPYNNGYGCPCVDTLHLTIHHSTHNVITETVCGGYTWTQNYGIDTMIFESGTYTHAYINEHGCNSVDTLHLTVFNHAITVITSDISNITLQSATCGGSVSASTTVTARGVCWSTSPNPTENDSHTTNGSGTGSFTSSLSGLVSGTTYYVRAYATNGLCTAYGEQKSFTTLALPTVVTSGVGNITATSASCGGNVTSQGTTSVTARGVCWSTSQNPTINDSHTSDGTGTGNFTSNITGLNPNTTYYVRAYATNSVGTSYGEQTTFKTNCNTVNISIAGSTSINYGQNTTLTASGANTYHWSTNATTASITVSPTATTTYSVTGTNSYGCTATADVTVTVNYIAPTVITNEVTSIRENSAIGGGVVISDGGATLTARGVCWSTSQNPTINDSHTNDGSGTGNFSSSITELTPNTTYYVRAYATNSVGTAYGEEVSFTTTSAIPAGDGQPCLGAPTVTDVDGNTYNTVQIGGQCWMKENLRTTKYSNGTSIVHGDDENTYSRSSGFWYYPDNNISNKQTYGLLYNWPAVMNGAASSDATPSGVQGICPTGWHVPSRAEWQQLTYYLSRQSLYVCGNDTTSVAKALAANIEWVNGDGSHCLTECCVSYNLTTNNTTSFSALPAGLYSSGWFSPGEYTAYWTTTEEDFDWAISSEIMAIWDNVSVGGIYKDDGYSIRCLRDEVYSQYFPMVTTDSSSNITSSTATCRGNVAVDGNMDVITRGVCWSVLRDPTIADSHSICGSGTGSFISNITGLISNHTYFVRAYATTPFGTVYGNEVRFTTGVDSNGDEYSCPGVPTVVDIDGNTYNTVQIGEQCWMRENLRTTTFSDGTPISQGSYSSTTTKYWYYPDNKSSYKTTYGLLYNWSAVMYESSSSDANPSDVQGICPTGWHVPSDSEWAQLTIYVSGQNGYMCDEDSSSIGKALAGTEGWDSYYQTCTIGNNPSTNNTTGFSAIPAGQNYSQYYQNFRTIAYYWSSTESDVSHVFTRSLGRAGKGVGRGAYPKYYSNSVRCLRDETSTAVIDSKSCPADPTVTDHEGNVYATVQIGNQCWMRENLRTTTSPSTGTYLITSANNYTFTGKQARWYNNDSTTYAPMKCGLLYNWNAAVDTFNTSFGEISVNTSISNGVSVSFTGHRRGICPVGWHLPSDAEWTQLTNYVSSQSEYVCGGNSNYIAKALADSIGWHSSTNTYYGTCAVYYNLAANNATGFSAFPAGAYGYTGDYLDLGDGAYFFSASQYNVHDAYNRSLHCDMAEVYEGNDSYKANGLSVRCLRD